MRSNGSQFQPVRPTVIGCEYLRGIMEQTDQRETARRERLEAIVGVLFPVYSVVSVRYGHAAKPPIHPEKSWWWNGASINECYENGNGSVALSLRSYVGNNEYDDFDFTIPAGLMETPDWRAAVLTWIETETARINEIERQREIKKAECDIKRNTERLAKLLIDKN